MRLWWRLRGVAWDAVPELMVEYIRPPQKNAGENKSREVIAFFELNQKESTATSALRMSSGRMAGVNHLSIP